MYTILAYMKGRFSSKPSEAEKAAVLMEVATVVEESVV
jgi:hypothetical protein